MGVVFEAHENGDKMKVIKFATWKSMDDFIAGKPADLEVSEGWGGKVALCDRSATSAAKGARDTARDTAATLGSEATGEHSQLQPFFAQEMNAKHGFDPTQTNELLTAALAGSGGAAGSLKGEAELEAARTRNPSGFTKALDEAAREKMKAAAGASEGIAAQDVMGAKALNQAGASGMTGLFSHDLSGQLGAMGAENSAIGTQIEAGKSGWLQNLNSTLSTIGGLASPIKALKGK